MTVTKRELVIQVANTLGMTQSDVAKIVDELFEALARNLAAGKRWELRDFGVFEAKTRASRIGRNPRTGDQVPVPARRVVTFRPGKEMRDRVAASAPAAGPTAAPDEGFAVLGLVQEQTPGSDSGKGDEVTPPPMRSSE